MDEIFQISGTCLTVMMPAEVDHHNTEFLKQGIDRLMKMQNIRTVAFDFQKTTFMDSSGVGMIIGRYRRIRYMGGRTVAIHVKEPIHKILILSGIYKLIDLYEGEQSQSRLL